MKHKSVIKSPKSYLSKQEYLYLAKMHTATADPVVFLALTLNPIKRGRTKTKSRSKINKN
jgi:hypothetical protein